MPRVILFIVLMIGSILLSCTNNPVGGHDPIASTVVTTLSGTVILTNGHRPSGVVITAYGRTATTNEYGVFLLKDISVPTDQCVISAHKNGLITVWKSAVPNTGGVTHFNILMDFLKTSPSVVTAENGGTVMLPEGGSLHIPAGSIVTEDGQLYNGSASVDVQWFNPTASNFYAAFPGSYAGVRIDGSDAWLYFYGVSGIQLLTPDGINLQIADGHKLALVLPIPASMQPTAPAEISLWYFDKSRGIWKEEGKAVKQGIVYTAEIGYVGMWGAAIPQQQAVIEGTVWFNNTPVPNIIVRVGQSEVITDLNGRYRCSVPTDMVIEISVQGQQNDGVETVVPVTVNPITVGQTVVQDISVTMFPSYIAGSLVNCSGQPADGMLIFARGNTIFHSVTTNGQYLLRVDPGKDVIIQVVGVNPAMTRLMPVRAVASGTITEVSPQTMCSSDISFHDISPDVSYPQGASSYAEGSDIALSADGRYLVVATVENVYCYNAETGTLLYKFPYKTMRAKGYVKISRDGTKFLVARHTDAVTTSAEVHDVVTGALITELPAEKPLFSVDGTEVWDLVRIPSRFLCTIYSSTENKKIREYILPYIDHDQVSKASLSNLSLLGVYPDNRRCALLPYFYESRSAWGEHNFIVWDMEKNEEISRWKTGAEGYLASETAVSDDLSTIVFLWQYSILHYRNTLTGQVYSIGSLLKSVYKYGFNHDASIFVAQVKEKGSLVRLYGRPLSTIYSKPIPGEELPIPVPDAQFIQYQFSKDNRYLAGLWRSDDKMKGGIRVWRLW